MLRKKLELMDEQTGHLVELTSDQSLPAGYTLVPSHLEEAARQALAGQVETVIDPAGIGPMSQFLRDRRQMTRKQVKKRRRLRKAKKRRLS